MKSIKLHRQSTDYSCGSTSLKMVLGHFGVDKSEEELINLTGAKVGLGCTPSDISKLTATDITLANPTHGEFTTMTHSAFLNRWFELDDYPPKDAGKFFLREAISISKPTV